MHKIFGDEVTDLEQILVSEAGDDEIVTAADRFFQSRIPKPDSNADLARGLVQEVLEHRDLLTVDQLARRSGLGKPRSSEEFRRDQNFGAPPILALLL